MISRDSSPLVSLFAKAPVPGLVKTRMRAELGDQVCAELATRMLRDVAVRLEKHWPGPRAIAVTPDTDHPAVVEIAQRHGFALEKQTGSDLGERMGSALAQGISRFGSAVVLGADIPQLTAGELRAAQAGLSRGEEVLGPTLDGGFYLLGLHHWDARLFDGVQWGGQDVCCGEYSRMAGALAGRSTCWRQCAISTSTLTCSGWHEKIMRTVHFCTCGTGPSEVAGLG